MIKSTKSVLLVAMMAVSGFAVAQPAAPANDVKSGTQGGSGPSASEKAMPGNMPNSRADVKSEAVPMKSGIQGGEGASPGTNPNTARTREGTGATNTGVSTKSRAEVKAEATPMKSGTQGGSGPSANEKAAPGTMSKARSEVKAEAAPMKAGVDGGKATAPDVKMTAAERRAANANKEKRTPASKADAMKDGKSAN